MKKYLALLLILLALPLNAFAGQNTLDTDVFGGTAATNLHTYNANWDLATFGTSCNDNKISTPNGGVVGAGGTSCDGRDGQTWTNDQFAQGTVAALPTASTLVCVRLGGSAGNINSGYCVGPIPNIGTNAYRLVKANALNTTVKLSATVALANDVVNIQVVGTTITVKVNGATIADLTTTDASFATGKPGIIQQDTTGKLTTWSAGSVTGAGSTASSVDVKDIAADVSLLKSNIVIP